MELLGPNLRQAGLIERACKSPTCLTDASASSRAVLGYSVFKLADCSGSKGGAFEGSQDRWQIPCRDREGSGRMEPPGTPQEMDN